MHELELEFKGDRGVWGEGTADPGRHFNWSCYIKYPTDRYEPRFRIEQDTPGSNVRYHAWGSYEKEIGDFLIDIFDDMYYEALNSKPMYTEYRSDCRDIATEVYKVLTEDPEIRLTTNEEDRDFPFVESLSEEEAKARMELVKSVIEEFLPEVEKLAQKYIEAERDMVAKQNSYRSRFHAAHDNRKADKEVQGRFSGKEWEVQLYIRNSFKDKLKTKIVTVDNLDDIDPLSIPSLSWAWRDEDSANKLNLLVGYADDGYGREPHIPIILAKKVGERVRKMYSYTKDGHWIPCECWGIGGAGDNMNVTATMDDFNV